MNCLHQKNPGYDWETNKGYPTLKHRKAIQNFGISIHHRKTFRLFAVNSQLNLFN
jgi:ribonuclease HII